MHLPKVSIIIPNYNHKPYLQQRLDSVLGQTFQDFEVIVLDDASTDGSQEVLKAYNNHPKVSHMVFNAVNSGSPFKQWHKGIALAQGEWIWIAESDDYCELDFLECLIVELEQRVNCVLAYCASSIIDDSGVFLGRHKWADALDHKRWTQLYENTGSDEIRRFLRYRNTITNASAVVFKKSVMSQVKIPIDMKFCGDWAVWIQVLKQGDIVYLPKLLNFFRRHNASTKTVKSFVKEQQRIKEYMSVFLTTSHLFDRIINFKNYLWVLHEWRHKARFFPGKTLIDLRLPFEFLIYFKIKEKR